MSRVVNRRQFVKSAVLGAGVLVVPYRAAFTYEAGEKIQVALVGVGGRGTWFVETIPAMERVTVLCDVNEAKIAETFTRWEELARKMADSPQPWERERAKQYQRLCESRPKTYYDFRKMLDEASREIDAVIVATPDHTHAVISAAAMKAGKHVFCEKPLTRTVHESRALREIARKSNVATSMGNQGTASGQFRRAVELVREGVLGEIREVHVWNDGGGADRQQPPRGEQPIPPGFHWDLWLGPAAARPYHREWLQRNSWREFGTGQLGNWASHSANLAFMALYVHELWLKESLTPEQRLIRIHAEHSGINRLSFPRWERITWEIPPRGEMPAVKLIWHNGPGSGGRELVESLRQEAVGLVERDRDLLQWAGALLIGTQGRMVLTGHNATFCLLPHEKFKDVPKDRPLKLDASRGHEADWFAACRGGKPAWANFDYASALNEFLMLGNVATQVEDSLVYDPVEMKVVNSEKANELLSCEYRSGWTL